MFTGVCLSTGGCLVWGGWGEAPGPGGAWSWGVPGPGGIWPGGIWPGGVPGGDPPQRATTVGGTHSCFRFFFRLLDV